MLAIGIDAISVRAMTQAHEGTRKECINLHEIDLRCTSVVCGDLTMEEKGLLRHIQQCAAWDKHKLRTTGRFDEEKSELCDLCGEVQHSIAHIVFDCPALRRKRLDLGPHIVNITSWSMAGTWTLGTSLT